MTNINNHLARAMYGAKIMNDFYIEEERKKCQRRITNLIRKYEENTGVIVSSVNLCRVTGWDENGDEYDNYLIDVNIQS